MPPLNSLQKTALAVAISQSMAGTVSAATINVDNNCSLADAIVSANTDSGVNQCESGSGADTIELIKDSVFDYDEEIDGAKGNALPFITSEITINGNGSIISRANNAPEFRIMAVFTPGGLTNNGYLRLNDLTLQGGSLTGYNGGALFVADGTTAILNEVTVSNNSISEGAGGGVFSKGTLRVINSTVSGNSADYYGGGVYSSNSSVSINNSTVSGNSTSRYGAGIYSLNSSVSINKSTVSDNSTNRYGGGIYSYNSSVSINYSTIADNSSNFGGGMYSYESSVNIDNSTITGNSSNFGGGGLISYASSVSINNSMLSNNIGDSGIAVYNNSVVLNNCTVSNNTSWSFGGGIFSGEYTSLTIINSTVSNNYSSYGGGGIRAYSSARVKLINSTISGNSTRGGGGAIMVESTIVNITNSTVSDNTAQYRGGGLRVSDDGSVTFVNSIISGNQANTSGDEVYSFTNTGISSKNTIFGHSAITNAQAFTGFTPNSNNITATNGGTIPTALNHILQPLRNNGSGTKTHALSTNSPAIGFGISATCNAAPVSRLDQRGYVRSGTCDAGAYEFGASAPPTPPINPATIIPTINLLLDED